jgi:hypothetical protein
VEVGSKLYCSEDDDSDGRWLPPDDNPHPWTNPDDLLVEMTEDHGLRVGNNYSESLEWNIDWIRWNISMIPYEIDRRDVECPGCIELGIGILVDLAGIAADMAAIIGFPELELPATTLEFTWIQIRYLSGNDIVYDTQLFIDQQNADKLAAVPGTGIPYSIWGMLLNLIDISQRFEYTIDY